MDAERVLQFLVNRLRLKGKIGAYGRSIGGIAASHLVGKFPKLMKVFIGDRTMGSLEELVRHRHKGYFRKSFVLIYRLLSNFWVVCNG